MEDYDPMATCLVLGHDYSEPGRSEDGSYGWRACACNGTLPAHSWGADPVDGRGCGMAWRLCRFCDHIDERPLTELTNPDDADYSADNVTNVRVVGPRHQFDLADGYCHIHGRHCSMSPEVQPGGSFRQDVAAGLALPNRPQEHMRRPTMLEAHAHAPDTIGRVQAWRIVRAALRLERLTPTPLDPDYGHGAGEPSRTPIRARLRWSSTDPGAVSIRLLGARAVWVFCQDLLRAGLRPPVGVGDVSVLPDPFHAGIAELVLSTDSGHACLAFETGEMVAFLDRIPVEFTVTDAAITDPFAEDTDAEETAGGAW